MKKSKLRNTGKKKRTSSENLLNENAEGFPRNLKNGKKNMK